MAKEEARRARLETAALRRHAARTEEQSTAITAAWNRRGILRNARKRHETRTEADKERIKMDYWKTHHINKNLTEAEKTAIAKNWIEIEKTLGIKKGSPMTVEEADKQSANPNYSVDKSYRINCQTCAPAYMLRLWGFDVKAKGNTPGSLFEWISKSHSFDIWGNPDGSKPKAALYADFLENRGYKKMTANRYDEFFEEKCKEVGVYITTIAWKGKGAHATILQRLPSGKLVHVEPQVYEGNVFMDYSDKLSKRASNADWKIEGRGVLRVDNKIFDKNYLSIFSK